MTFIDRSARWLELDCLNSCWYLDSLGKCVEHILENIRSKYVREIPTHNSLLNILWIYGQFQSYLQNYHWSRRHVSRSSGMNRFIHDDLYWPLSVVVGAGLSWSWISRWRDWVRLMNRQLRLRSLTGNFYCYDSPSYAFHRDWNIIAYYDLHAVSQSTILTC